jgi:hypothetical protein
MYARRAWAGRYYRCKHSLAGACDSKGIRADAAESNVLMHIETVVGEQLRTWLAERAEEHPVQRDVLANAAERKRARLRTLRRTLERAAEQHRRLLSGDDPALADAALRAVAAIEADVQAAAVAADAQPPAPGGGRRHGAGAPRSAPAAPDS